MDRQAKISKLFSGYMKWPSYIAVLFIALSILMFIVDTVSGLIMLFITVILLAVLALLYKNYKQYIDMAIVSYAVNFYKQQSELNIALDIPYAILNEGASVVWSNRKFDEIFDTNRQAYKKLTRVFGELDLSQISQKNEFCVKYNERKYKLVLKTAHADDMLLYSLYMYDETELGNIKHMLKDSAFVCGYICIDNYEEVITSVEDVQSSLLLALIDRKIKQYFGEDGVVHKLEKDKYFFVTNHHSLVQLKESRFEILEEAKETGIGNSKSVTLSIGIGEGGSTYAESSGYASMAIEMALARGGDQVVIKNKDGLVYFGGKSQSVERTTKVKARVKAKALSELMNSNKKVIIMGHKVMDIDCLGAAIGVWCIANELDRPAQIVSTEVNAAIRNVLDVFVPPAYPDDLFIDAKKAEKIIDKDTLLIVVDVNRPSITEAAELLTLTDNIVVIDHHRQGSESIKNAKLSYIESYASSACEMVAEILQYVEDGVKLKSDEADAMYAGIVVDTQNFKNQTGVRTFEAAAFLKRNGADTTRVRKLFRENVNDYIAKAEATHNVTIFEGHYAISYCPAEGLERPTVVCAQVANDLLNIIGIKASVVFTKVGNTVYISARSIDEVNVQMMMEKIGGGGHRAIAGAQLKDVDIETAIEKVKSLITDMIGKGEL